MEGTKEFNKLLTKLAELRWEFQVVKCDSLSEDDELVKHISSLRNHVGKDIRLLICPIENTEYLLYEFDVNGIINAYLELKSYY